MKNHRKQENETQAKSQTNETNHERSRYDGKGAVQVY
jgi:hypothetical protein